MDLFCFCQNSFYLTIFLMLCIYFFFFFFSLFSLYFLLSFIFIILFLFANNQTLFLFLVFPFIHDHLSINSSVFHILSYPANQIISFPFYQYNQFIFLTISYQFIHSSIHLLSIYSTIHSSIHLLSIHSPTHSSNFHTATSPAYRDFLSRLGCQIDLCGWTHFKGGLDTSPKRGTGTHSVHCVFRGFEIMFHVASMLPTKDDDDEMQV